MKRARFRQTLCGSKLICRRETAAKSGLNMRTVISYVEQYRGKGILSKKIVVEEKGRPEIIISAVLTVSLFPG